MTAHELARKLLAGPDVMVTRRGYEGGVVDITDVTHAHPIHLDVNNNDYYGPHEYCDPDGPQWCYTNLDQDDKHTVPETLAIHLS